MKRFRFKLDIIGPKGPEDVYIRDLFEFLADFEKALAVFLSDDALESVPLISLVGVRPGHSSRLFLSAAKPAGPGITEVTRAVKTGNYELLPRAAHEHFHNAYAHLKRREYTLLFHGSRKAKIARVKLTPQNGVTKPKPLTVSGRTTIIGRCMKVGGESPTVEVRIEGRAKALHVRVTEDIAKSVARRLYDQVVIEGEAVWRPDDWYLEEMQATSVTDYKPLPLPLAFERLAEASKGRWEGVDASDFVHGLREGRTSESTNGQEN